MAGQLVELHVHICYSLEAYEAFFPALVNRDQADNGYTATIGCNPWLFEIGEVLGVLLEGISEDFSAEVPMDLGELIDSDKAFRSSPLSAWSKFHRGKTNNAALGEQVWT